LRTIKVTRFKKFITGTLVYNLRPSNLKRNKTEDQFTKTIEEYTSAMPSSAYLGVALGAMALSLFFQVTAKENGATSSRSGCLRG
jgi:hypothetical protein